MSGVAGPGSAPGAPVRDVVVVGGSTAGATAMRELRGHGFDGRLVLVDPEAGTNRPPLSKAVLAGEDADASVLMDHAALDVEHHRTAAVGLDAAERVLRTADGGAHPYDALVVASGARARRLAGPGQRGEVVLRTLDDARRLRDRLGTAGAVVVVGAGFLGLEVASAAARAGAAVTVVDTAPPLRRLVGDHLADVLVRQAAGAGIRFRQAAVRLSGDPVDGVLLDGAHLPADLVVTCAGDEPAVDWLAGTGADLRGGLVIDERARTSLPGVWAAGDAAVVRRGDGVVRQPFWANAVAQGRVAAADVLRRPVDGPVLDPYSWTEVAGLSLKVLGLLPVHGPPRVVEGAVEGPGLLAWGDHTVAALGLRSSAPRLRALLRRRGDDGAGSGASPQ